MDLEKLASEFHDIYMKEAHRQGRVLHPDRYEDLEENIKEYDRVLARHVAIMLIEAKIEDKDLKLMEYSEQVLPSWVCNDLEKEIKELELQKQQLEKTNES